MKISAKLPMLFAQIFNGLLKEGDQYEVVLGFLSHLQNFLCPFAHVEVVSPFSVDWVRSAKEMVKGKQKAKCCDLNELEKWQPRDQKAIMQEV